MIHQLPSGKWQADFQRVGMRRLRANFDTPAQANDWLHIRRIEAESKTPRRTMTSRDQLDATEADLGQLMGWVVPEPVAPLTAREAAWVEEFMASDPADDAPDVPPYPGPVGYLAAWQRELDRGQRTRFQFDALWKAACWEAEADEVAASRPVAAMLALRDAHRVIEAAAR